VDQEEYIIDILQLINSDNLGPVTFYKLLQKFKTTKCIIENITEVKKVKLISRAKAESIFESACKKNIHILTFDDCDYPQKLSEIVNPPPILYTIGNHKILNHPKSLSVVGARNASINGRKTASKIAFDLTNSDVLIISGMARGIDAAAHKGALFAKEQRGYTVAVLGTGVDVPYPDENKFLYHQIIEQGCVVSEFAPDTIPQATNFPRRNRIVAAMSCGTLVVEATANSGSLITAEIASEYNRSIFAIPGAPSDPRSIGPNNLIKNGANLVVCATDIINLIKTPHINKPIKIKKLSQPELPLYKTENKNEHQTINKTKIIDYLNFDGVYVDEIIRASGMSAAEIALEVLELEMNGLIERQSGNKVALIKK